VTTPAARIPPAAETSIVSVREGQSFPLTIPRTSVIMTMSILARRLVLLLPLLLAAHVRADDWPQWLGPKGESVWRETGLLDKFPTSGPKVKWRVPVQDGYAGPAVAGGRVYVADYVTTGDKRPDPGKRNKLDGTERVLCLDAADGKTLWKHEYPCPYEVSYPGGPRCTPTVSGGKVYTLGTEGNLFCLDASNGSVVWGRELKKDYKTATPVWGFCGHPLVDGQKLICLVGGEGSVAVAFDKDTGKELWRALSAKEPGYCPPSIIEAGGVRQLLIWHSESINSLDPETGKVHWTVPLKPAYGMSISVPRKLGDYLFAGGIGNKAACLKLAADKPAAEVVWQGDAKNAVYPANSTPFLEDGTIYGCDSMGGQLRAVDLATGKRLWETFAPTTGGRRAGHGTAFLVKNGDRFFLMSETGHLIIARLSPQKYEEVSRAKILEPTGDAFGRDVVWSHPAFAEKCVFARNDKEVVCVSLAAE
jgi:outer membrane protein assembly factor BamB